MIETWPNKAWLIAYYKELKWFKLQFVVTHQWLKLHLPNFHTFYTNWLPLRQSTVQESNSQVSHHFLNLVLKISGEFQYSRGKMVILKRKALG